MTLREVGESVACRTSRVLAGVVWGVFGFPVGRKVQCSCAARCRAWDSPVAAAYDADVPLPG